MISIIFKFKQLKRLKKVKSFIYNMVLIIGPHNNHIIQKGIFKGKLLITDIQKNIKYKIHTINNNWNKY